MLDGEQRIAQAFGGELFAMHEAACAVVRQTAMRAVPAPFDVVLTTNSGFPLDQNLYQAVKGMSAAAQVVQPGGTIVCAAECRDGFPDHGSYRERADGGGVARRAARGDRGARRDGRRPVADPDPGRRSRRARA